MDDLVTWLRVQLDDDERVARALAGATRFMDRRPDFYGVGGPAADAYWDRFTPRERLAEVDAKRRILDDYEDYQRSAQEFREQGNPQRVLENMRDAYWAVVRLFALPYADRPGYREEWWP